MSRRGKFQGTLQILSYNWPFYVVGIVVAVVAIVALIRVPLPGSIRLLGFVGIFAALYWTLASIVASWYVYDYSPLCRWEWIPPLLPGTPETWANLHAGLDESTPTLQALFPGTRSYLFDFYDPVTMTEPSIRRARRLTPPEIAPVPVSSDALPLASDSLDTLFLLFAAHEIRDESLRLAFFRELQRVLRPGGRIVVAEHLRDTANFVAFGPGFLHFLPRPSWLRMGDGAGLRLVAEVPITPLTRVFVWERATQ